MQKNIPKMLIVRSNYYKQITCELTCGALLGASRHYLPQEKFLKARDIIMQMLDLGDDELVNMFANTPSIKYKKPINLIKGTIDALKHGLHTANIIDELLKLLTSYIHINIATTHGCLEIPHIISQNINNYNLIIALGCVIRGQTTHYQTVCDETNRAIMNLSISSTAVIANGIINVENHNQARARSGFWLKDHQDKGGGAVKAAISTMLEVSRLKDL